MEFNFINLVLMISVAAASGLVGVFALMRKMTLASDAISHIALPGLGLALLLKLNPFLGGAVALLLGALLIWGIEEKTKISTETVVGVVFSASLAVGALVTPDHELIEALFGDITGLTPLGAAVGIAVALLVMAFVFIYQHKLTLALVSKDLAVVAGINVSRMNLLFLLIFSLNVLLGLQFLGVLLMGSLIIVPAAVGRNLGGSLRGTLFISLVVAVLSVSIGYALSILYGIALGPVVIAAAAAFFFLSLLKSVF